MQAQHLQWANEPETLSQQHKGPVFPGVTPGRRWAFSGV